MRKFRIVFIILILCIIAMSIMGCASQNYSINKSEEVNLSEAAFEKLEYISANYSNRSMGSEKQDEVVGYLNAQLTSFGYEVSEQTFTADSTTSKNVIAKKSVNTTKDVIVLGASWDNMYEKYDTHPDGAYQTGASIAALLTISEYLSTKDLPYNLEIVFFAGSSGNWTGASYYLKKLTSEEKQNIKMFINYGYICGGDNLYIYAQEKATKYSNFINEVVAQNNISGITKVPQFKNTVAATISEDQIFTYSHIGMFGNNIIFMNNEIPSINYLSVNWSDYTYPIYTEVKGTANVIETENDTLEHMISRSTKEKIVSQFDSIIKSTVYTIVDNNETLMTTLGDDGITPFFQSQTAYYIFNVVVKILAAAIVLLFVAYAKNKISSNKDELQKMRASRSKIVNIDLSQLKDGTLTPDIFEEIIKQEEAKLKGEPLNKEDKTKKDDENIDDDDVFE